MIKGMKCTFSLSKPFWWKALISTSNFSKKNISLELELEVNILVMYAILKGRAVAFYLSELQRHDRNCRTELRCVSLRYLQGRRSANKSALVPSGMREAGRYNLRLRETLPDSKRENN